MSVHRAPDWARSFLREVSRPRLPGSDGVRQAESVVAQRLEILGLGVSRQEFTTSARRLHAVSIGAAGTGWAALLASPLMVLDIAPWVATLVILAAFGSVWLLSYGLAEGHLPLDLPTVAAVNLVATRTDRPRWWLVAHLDSKAQGVSLRGRVVAGVAMVGGAAAVAALSIVHLIHPVGWLAVPLMVITAAGAAALSVRPVHGDAPGAVDNASGILAVLAAADALADRADVGVLVTGAEEYGMEGARSWVQHGGAGEGFINFDGLDDRGAFNLMVHRARSDPVAAVRMEESLARKFVASGLEVRRSRLPLGVFVDGGVLVRADLPGVTVSHGDWTTLGVVHTRRDTADRLTGDTAWNAGREVAAVMRTFG